MCNADEGTGPENLTRCPTSEHIFKKKEKKKIVFILSFILSQGNRILLAVKYISIKTHGFCIDRICKNITIHKGVNLQSPVFSDWVPNAEKLDVK